MDIVGGLDQGLPQAFPRYHVPLHFRRTQQIHFISKMPYLSHEVDESATRCFISVSSAKTGGPGTVGVGSFQALVFQTKPCSRAPPLDFPVRSSFASRSNGPNTTRKSAIAECESHHVLHPHPKRQTLTSCKLLTQVPKSTTHPQTSPAVGLCQGKPRGARMVPRSTGPLLLPSLQGEIRQKLPPHWDISLVTLGQS